MKRADTDLMTCPRCGLTRPFRSGRGTTHCQACKHQIARQHVIANEPAPERQRRAGGVWVYVTTCHCGTKHPVAQTCPTCLTWAERDAERHQWRKTSKANRHRIWDVLKQRKEAA